MPPLPKHPPEAQELRCPRHTHNKKAASQGFPEPPTSPQDLAPHFSRVRAWVEEITDDHQLVLMIMEMRVVHASLMDLGAVPSEGCFSLSWDINLLNP